MAEWMRTPRFTPAGVLYLVTVVAFGVAWGPGLAAAAAVGFGLTYLALTTPQR